MPLAHRLAAAALIGTSGTLVMLAMLGTHWGGDWPFIPAATIGASCTGYALAGFFGHPGRRGLHLSMLGAVLTTFLGAAIAGLGLGIVMAGTLAGVIMGPWAVLITLLNTPWILATWISTMAAAQLVMREVRTPHLIPS